MVRISDRSFFISLPQHITNDSALRGLGASGQKVTNDRDIKGAPMSDIDIFLRNLQGNHINQTLCLGI